MTYPPEFSAQARVRVEAERLRAKELRTRRLLISPRRTSGELFPARAQQSNARPFAILPGKGATQESLTEALSEDLEDFKVGQEDAKRIWRTSALWWYIVQVFQAVQQGSTEIGKSGYVGAGARPGRV